MKIQYLKAFLLVVGVIISISFDKINSYLTSLNDEELVTYCGVFEGIYATTSKGSTNRFIHVNTPNGELKKFKVNQYVSKSSTESKYVDFKFDVRENDQICVLTKKMFFRNSLVLNVYKNQF